MSSSEFRDGDAGAVVASCPMQKAASQPPVHWIEIALVGDDGKPIPGVKYTVTLPGGEAITAYLDGTGVARLENIQQAGDCKITFPELDTEAWQPV